MKKTMLIAMALGLALCWAGLAGAQGMPNAEKLGWHVGCQAYSFNHFTFYDAIDKTASIGLHYIEAYPGQELSKDMPGAKMDADMPADLQKKVLEKLQASNVKLMNFGVVGLPGDEAKARKVFDFAKAMGIETIVSEPEPKDLPMLDKLANEYAINIAIHNHPKPSKYWNPDKVLEVTKGLSKRVGSCSDTGHWMRSGINPLEAIKKLDGHIISLHFKDLNEFGNKDAHDVPWGTGQADIKAIMAELKRQGFKGVFSAEYEWNWDNSAPEIGESAKNFEKLAGELAK
jgi:sugar phosphate isomerase/epimerase